VEAEIHLLPLRRKEITAGVLKVMLGVPLQLLLVVVAVLVLLVVLLPTLVAPATVVMEPHHLSRA
jgi:hypothetical protein